MKWSTTVVLTTAACVLTAWTVVGQSLTEAAAKEKERRNKAKSSKTYTENELRSAGQGFSPEATAGAAAEGSTTAAASADGSKPAPVTDPAAKADEERAKQEKAWSDKFKAVETEHRQWSEEAASIQTQLSDTSVAQYGPGRQRATQALNEATAKLAALKQQMADLEEEGRRSRFKR